jgi:NAD(P)H-hydrate epimerase
MENAGRGVADILGQLGIHGPVLVCCGKGNNAGDGLVLARHLDLRGFQVEVACWHDPSAWTGDAAANAEIARRGGISLQNYQDRRQAFQQRIRAADWVIDALLGTGTRGAPRQPFDQVIRDLNARTTARLLAIDLPSGLDADTGVPQEPTIRANLTCTFVAEKTGFTFPAARACLGEVRVVDIGAPRKLVDEIAREVSG